jgi:hypothetical protein
MAHQTAYHVILMDCDLPVMDGWQAGALHSFTFQLSLSRF